MPAWFFYAVWAAVLYGLHQIFTKLAAAKIGDGLGGFVVEATAAMTILLYLAWLRLAGTWNQTSSTPGVLYSVLTGICVGAGTIMFFVLFQKGRNPCPVLRREELSSQRSLRQQIHPVHPRFWRPRVW